MLRGTLALALSSWPRRVLCIPWTHAYSVLKRVTNLSEDDGECFQADPRPSVPPPRAQPPPRLLHRVGGVELVWPARPHLSDTRNELVLEDGSLLTYKRPPKGFFARRAANKADPSQPVFTPITPELKLRIRDLRRTNPFVWSVRRTAAHFNLRRSTVSKIAPISEASRDAIRTADRKRTGEGNADTFLARLLRMGPATTPRQKMRLVVRVPRKHSRVFVSRELEQKFLKVMGWTNSQVGHAAPSIVRLKQQMRLAIARENADKIKRIITQRIASMDELNERQRSDREEREIEMEMEVEEEQKRKKKEKKKKKAKGKD